LWTAHQTHELARAIVVAGDTFSVRRILQRLERGEIDIAAATGAIRSGHATALRARAAADRCEWGPATRFPR
jgi:hypothetical protein